MSFVLSNFRQPQFEYRMDEESPVQSVDFYDAAQKIQHLELKYKKEKWETMNHELETLEDFAFEIVRHVVIDVFALPADTSLSMCKALLSQFVKEFQTVEGANPELVKN